MNYLFTDQSGKEIIEVVDLKGADEAQGYRKKMRKNKRKEVIAWLQIGGDNPDLLND